MFGRRRPAPRPRTGPVGVLSAAGFFALAGVILAWPRERGVGQRLSDAAQRLRLAAAGRAELTTPTTGVEAAANALREPGHGRDATDPLHIPPKGWWDILVRAWSEFNADQIPAVAAGVAFFGLLSMFPAIAAFVSLYGLFFDLKTVRKQLDILAGFLPHDILGFVGDQMVRIASAHTGGLSVAFFTGLLLSLWSANGAVKSLFSGLNVSYEEKERRGLVKLNLISLAFTVGGLVFVILTLAVVVVAPLAFHLIGLHGGSAGSSLLSILRWPAILVVVVLALSVLYRYGPSRATARWRWVTWGSTAAGVLWLLVSLLFSWYVSNFGHYNATYGSLGAVIGFMTWLWLSTTVILFGAELNAEIEHQTAVDTTTGAPLPLGGRGAKMADTVGPVAGSAKQKAQTRKSKMDAAQKRDGA